MSLCNEMETNGVHGIIFHKAGVDMEHKALYREYRPKTFDEVVGQKHVIDALRNSVKNNRIAHAYLFCGTRGTGKTSVAKIFSRAVNCLLPQNGNPCNKCDICKAILSESLLDVIEIDAASNNSVDNVRDIREEVVYLPAEAAKKVYIIDEVHMLSQGAFNALLKTLEEPPSHVIFILATTDPGKLPPTILSRCQRYDFKRISYELIYERISSLCVQLGVKAEKKALELIARTSDGALRDALSILDKCISVSDKMLSYTDVLALANITDMGLLLDIADALMRSDGKDIIQKIDDYEKNGLDFKFFVTEMLEMLRNLLVCVLVDEPDKLIIADPDMIALMKVTAEGIGRERLTRFITRLGELNRDIKFAHRPKIFVELALLELTGDRSSAQTAPAAALAGDNTEPLKKQTAGFENELSDIWDMTVEKLHENGNIAVAMYLKGTVLKAQNGRYEIIFDLNDERKKKTVEKNENLEKIRSVLSSTLGKDVNALFCVLKDEHGDERKEGFSEAGIKALFEGVPIDIIEG